MRVMLSQVGGKCKKADEDPLLELDREDYEADLLEEWMLCKLDFHGYNITYNDCQDSDMVLVGVLSRINSMTWRNNLKNEIMALTEWQENLFSFWLYPSTLSCNVKSTMTSVLIIDID
jgi:hypothetical protein